MRLQAVNVRRLQMRIAKAVMESLCITAGSSDKEGPLECLSLMMGNYLVGLCVQLRLVCSAGDSPAGVTVRSPVAWMADTRETKCLKPIDKALSWGCERVTGP
jgi:hypothetical protein